MPLGGGFYLISGIFFPQFDSPEAPRHFGENHSSLAAILPELFSSKVYVSGGYDLRSFKGYGIAVFPYVSTVAVRLPFHRSGNFNILLESSETKESNSENRDSLSFFVPELFKFKTYGVQVPEQRPELTTFYRPYFRCACAHASEFCHGPRGL